MTKDNYARNVSLSCFAILLTVIFLIGLLSGFTIVKVQDKIDEHNYTNLLIIYDIKKELDNPFIP